MDKRRYLDRARRVMTALERAVPWLALTAEPVAVFLVLRGQRDAIETIDSIGWTAVAASALAFTLAPLVQGMSFWVSLRLLTRRTTLLDAMVVWSRSYLVRYVPTGTLAVAYRVSARHRLGASGDQVLAAFTYEHLAVVAAAAVACLVLFPLAGDIPPLLPLVIALVTLAFTALVRPGLAGRAVQAASRRCGLHLDVILEARQLATLVALNMLGWLGTGAAVYLLVTTATGTVPPFLWLVGSYTAGYLVGFVAPLSPGGLGVREGMLVVLLAPQYGIGTALVLSLAIRLANIAGELLAVGFVHAVWAVRAASSRMRRLTAGQVAEARERVGEPTMKRRRLAMRRIPALETPNAT